MNTLIRFRWILLLAIGAAMMFAPVLAAKASQPEESAKSTTRTTTHKRHKSTAKTHIATNAAQTTKATSSAKRSSRHKKKRVRGQQKIDGERARAIQEALIREHYMTGEATGTWTAASEDAMRRYQADHGWQSKTVPDSRALISLGLGPSNDHLLNPESAMTSGPATPNAEPLPTNSQPPIPVSTPSTPTQADPPRPQ